MTYYETIYVLSRLGLAAGFGLFVLFAFLSYRDWLRRKRDLQARIREVEWETRAWMDAVEQEQGEFADRAFHTPEDAARRVG